MTVPATTRGEPDDARRPAPARRDHPAPTGTPRLARGICWSDLVAEMAAEQRARELRTREPRITTDDAAAA